MFQFISKKIANIKILHEGYTADYFLNRMNQTHYFQSFLFKIIKKNQVYTDIFYQIIAQCAF
jgi:hypothetical protein